MTACAFERKVPRSYKTMAARLRHAMEDAERWNAGHEIGAPVCVHRDNGDVLRTVTRSHAQILCDSAVVWVDGIAGCYALWCIHAIEVRP